MRGGPRQCWPYDVGRFCEIGGGDVVLRERFGRDAVEQSLVAREDWLSAREGVLGGRVADTWRFSSRGQSLERYTALALSSLEDTSISSSLAMGPKSFSLVSWSSSDLG